MKKTVFLMILVMALTALCCGIALADTVPVTETTTVWTDGNTYLAIGDVTIPERIQVQGTVTLSLTSGATLNATQGIHVSEGNSLTIEGSGTLNATGGKYQAGIGGDNGEGAGAITINSGIITAKGGYEGAGIGGGERGPGGTITIHGGTVTANSGTDGAGIGAGSYRNTSNWDGSERGSITITGGTIVAKGNGCGSGIGGGFCSCGGTIRITGGKVTAKAVSYPMKAIGGDRYDFNPTSITLGWTENDDYIDASGFYGNIYFVPEKLFILDGTTMIATTTNIFKKNVRLLPNFREVYNVTVEAAENGTVSPDQNMALDENLITLTPQCPEEYEVESITVTSASGDVDVTRIDANTWQFIMPKNDVTVTPVICALRPVSISTSEGQKACMPLIHSSTTLGSAGSSSWYAATKNLTYSTRIEIVGNVKLYLCEGTTLTCKKGIHVSGNNSLTIEGEGSLIAENKYYDGEAGIGGNKYENAGTIEIRSGTIRAINLDKTTEGAGIGGGNEGSGGNITISGGTVTATGGNLSAGIGGGDNGSGGNITISGGTVTATGGEMSAGIGGGSSGNGGTITITGGTVTATGGELSAGIGGGNRSSGGSITISGGTVTATGGEDSAGIGGGSSGNGGTITITGGTVSATGGIESAGIGGGSNGNGGIITITGGYVTAIGVENGAGIGGGYYSAGGNITISGGTVTATGGDSSPGIGSGYFAGDGVTIRILGGRVTAYGCFDHNGVATLGIGSTKSNSADSITLGWTNADDFIECCGYSGTVHFAEGKPFYVSDTMEVASWPDHVNGLLIPATGTYHSITVDSTGNGTIQADVRKAIQNQRVWLTWSSSERYIIPSVLTVKDSRNQNITVTTTGHTSWFTMPDDSVTVHAEFSRASTVQTTTSEGTRTCTPINAFLNFSEYSSGWYAVTEDTTIPERVTISGDVKIYLCAGATLTCARGITVEGNNSLTIDGPGTLIANARGVDYAAGIGGQSSPCGKITIHGGKITARGGEGSAGIGGCMESSGGTIVIDGGTVSATSGNLGAGIGGGLHGSGGVIRISGGTVTAAASYCGAGIGGGDGGAGGQITITGGTVTATGQYTGAGIGGADGAGGVITITGGHVTANGGKYSAGIGGGYYGPGGTIMIEGGEVTANGGTGSAGIGGGIGGSGGNVTISGGKIHADGPVGIGHGLYGSGGSVTLGWTDMEDSIYASSYRCDVRYAEGKYFQIRDTGERARKDNIDGQALIPCNGPFYTINAVENDVSRVSEIYLDDMAAWMNGAVSGLSINGRLTEAVSGVIVYAECSVSFPYNASGLTVTTQSGGNVDVTRVDENTFSFVMPAENVTLQPQTTEIIPVIRKTSEGEKRCYPLNSRVNNWYEDRFDGWYIVTEDITCNSGIAVRSGNVGLYLEEGKTYRCKFIYVPAGNGLTIEGKGTLIVDASQSNGWPGIGGGGNIRIRDGNITVTGPDYYAAIGGGSGFASGPITISGGNITARGGDLAAGIGSGFQNTCDRITITGGNIKAYGGNSAAGIGSGFRGTCSQITITGGTVNANGGPSGAGIGGGYASPANVRISGGTITATGGYEGAGIGGGAGAACGNIAISGGRIIANGGGTDNWTVCHGYGAGIGDGLLAQGAGGSITITGGQITATGGYVSVYKTTAAGIGSGGSSNASSPDTITLGWTGENDYIEVSSIDGDLRFAEGCFFRPEGQHAYATTENTHDVRVVACPPLYSITLPENTENGTLASSLPAAFAGEEVILTLTPETGYEVNELSVLQGTEPVAVTEDRFIMPAGDVTVTAAFGKIPDRTITFDHGEHGVGSMDPVQVESGTEYTLPESTFTWQGLWRFVGWQVGDDPDDLKKPDDKILVDADLTLTAVYCQYYWVLFYDENRNVLYWVDVPEGETPVYEGPTPERASDAQYNYTFDGWTPALGAAGGDKYYIEYYVHYETELLSYPVHFTDWEGTEIYTETVNYGEVPPIPDLAPEKPSDALYSYTFRGWTPEPAPITGETTLTADYDETPILQLGDSIVDFDGQMSVERLFTPAEDGTYRFWTTYDGVFSMISFYDSQGNEIEKTNYIMGSGLNIDCTVELEGGENYTVCLTDSYQHVKYLPIHAAKVQMYPITVDRDIEHGEILCAAQGFGGQQVYLEVQPEEGWQMEKLIVTDNRGTRTEIDWTVGGSFEMPESGVIVTGIFSRVYTLTVGEGDEMAWFEDMIIDGDGYGAAGGCELEVIPGRTIWLTWYVTDNCALDSITIEKQSGDAVEYTIENTSWGKTIQFTMPAEAVNILITGRHQPFGQADFTLPAGTKEIGQEAFEGAGMRAVYIPDGCERIGEGAFRNCERLEKIRIPADCEIGRNAFTGCGKVYVYGVAGSPAEDYCRNHEGCEFVSVGE